MCKTYRHTSTNYSSPIHTMIWSLINHIMNECTVEISPGEFKEGTINFFDIHTNRFFVELNGEYHWYPRMQVCTKSDIKKLPGYKLIITFLPVE